jgi:hypothetical protein
MMGEYLGVTGVRHFFQASELRLRIASSAAAVVDVSRLHSVRQPVS